MEHELDALKMKWPLHCISNEWFYANNNLINCRNYGRQKDQHAVYISLILFGLNLSQTSIMDNAWYQSIKQWAGPIGIHVKILSKHQLELMYSWNRIYLNYYPENS